MSMTLTTITLSAYPTSLNSMGSQEKSKLFLADLGLGLLDIGAAV